MLVLNMMSNSGSKIKIRICCTKRGVVLHCCHLCVWLSMALNSNSFSSWSSKGKWKEIRLNWDKSNERETMTMSVVSQLSFSLSAGRSVNEVFNLSDIQLLSQSESISQSTKEVKSDQSNNSAASQPTRTTNVLNRIQSMNQSIIIQFITCSISQSVSFR